MAAFHIAVRILSSDQIYTRSALIFSVLNEIIGSIRDGHWLPLDREQRLGRCRSSQSSEGRADLLPRGGRVRGAPRRCT